MKRSMENDLNDFDNMESDVPSTPYSVADSPAPQKKKRKAWGQPIPDFDKIIGPRKRAKTDAEKTQRAHERTLRNRRAAAQSRDKKQAQFALMEIENQELRDQLAQYQARFGALSHELSAPVASTSQQFSSITLPSYPTPSPETTFQSDFSTPQSLSINQDTPLISHLSLSPTLAPTLHLDHSPLQEQLDYQEEESAPAPAMVGDLVDAAQYSAAVLSDQQCLASTKSYNQDQAPATKLSFNLSLHLINLTMLMTTFENFSSTMLSPLYQILRTLAADFSLASTTQEDLDQHFQLIYCLITSPMKGTARPVFRTKLLSRFLACNPITARLITVAADRALQRQVAEDSSLEDPESCHKWASLMTLRWTIKWLEKEHASYRQICQMRMSSRETSDKHKSSSAPQQSFGHESVDYRAVAKSAWRWGDWELHEPLRAF